MNPLLNRIYQTKNRATSQKHKQQSSSIDKVLVPKLNTKIKLQALNAIQNPVQRQKTVFIKPYIGKLPSLNKQRKEQQQFYTQKKIQNKNKSQFRSRRLSSHLRQNQLTFSRQGAQFSFNLPSQSPLNFDNQHQPVLQRLNTKTKTVIKDSSMLTQAIFQQKQDKNRKSTLKSIGIQQKKYYPQNLENQQSLKKTNILQEKQDEQDELFQYLNVLQQNPDLNEQFCYMNRKQKPYSFYIVDYSQRNKNQFLTVSLRGITYTKVQDQQTSNQFFTIKQMTKDVFRYKTLKKIPFFKNYAVQKTINHWKISMFRKKFLNKCQYIKSTLFSQNQINLIFFNTLHSLYQDYCKGNFFQLSIQNTIPNLKEIKNQKMIIKRKQIDDNFSKFQKQIKKHLLDCLNENMNKFRRQKRVTLGTSDKLQKSQSFLPFDNKKKAMKFTQLAKLKQFQQYLYRIIKYTDMVRYNLKIQYFTNSIKNSKKQMDNLLSNYLNRQNRSFVSWIQCHVQIIGNEQGQNFIQKEQKNQEENTFLTSSKVQNIKSNNQLTSYYSLKLQPTLQAIQQCFFEHKNECVKLLWNNHYFLIDKKDQLLCNQFTPQANQFPTKLDLKYYLQKTDSIIQLQLLFQQSFIQILQRIRHHQDYLSSSLLKIYNQSFLVQPIQNYLQNQRLRIYLQNYTKQKEVIQKCQEYIQFGLILLKVDDFKSKVKKNYQEKYKAIITAIPQQVLKRTQILAKEVRQIYVKFKQNPSNVKQYIQFSKVFHTQKSRLFLVQKKIEDLLQLESMVYKNGIKIADSFKNHITQSQTLFRELQKRFQQIEENQQKERKKFEMAIDAMIPQIQQKSQQLLKQIQNDDLLQNPNSQINIVLQRLSDYSIKFQKIKNKKQELFNYQLLLQLGHKDLEQYFKLEIIFEWYNKLWNGQKQYLDFQTITKQKGYGQIDNLDVNPLISHLKNIQNSSLDIQAVDLLQEFKLKTTRLIHIIKLSKLIATDTYQPEHCDQIKKIMTFTLKKIKDLIFTRQGSRTITCEQFYTNTNIVQIEHEVSEIAFRSSQQNIIKKKLTQVQQFWRKNKVKFISQDIVGNGSLVMHLDKNQQLHQKIGLFNLSLKNIQSSGNAQGAILERLQIQIKITIYLRKLLQLWQQVQTQWLKLLPMMTNCPSVKHQSNVYFQFSSVDSAMRKIIKQISDMSSMRKLVQDYDQRKQINTLQKCSSELKAINKVFQQFLQTKRSTYNRFYFLTDQQLISIIQNIKDSKTFAKYGGFCFNCQQIDMDSELINGFKTQQQIFKLRKAMLRGEPDQMFKSISQNMKTSIKFSVRNLVPKMKISINIQQQLRQNSLQVCLLSDLLIWTEMTQTYLNATSYEEYQLIAKRTNEQLVKILPKIGKDLWIKVAIRYVHASHLKQISQSLIQNQITKSDFKWKEQLKYTFEEDQIAIRQFNFKMNHGLQYYPPEKIFIPTLNTQRFIYQAYYACQTHKLFAVNGHQGQGKRNLIKDASSRVGIYQKEVVCNSNLKINYLQRFIQGAILSGAWLSFYEYSNLKNQVIYELLANISKAKSEQKCHPRTLFFMVNHGYEFKKISMFKYNNYTVVQPDHKKISDYLLQMYRFRQWEQLSKKIISYLKTIKPLMQNIMGSHLSLIRKIIDGAGYKKIHGKNSDNQNLMIVQMIRKQIIDKSQQNVAILLKKALISYFNVEQKITAVQQQYNEKVSILKEIIEKKDSKNIMVIGSRSCKSTLINQALIQLNLVSQKLFPQVQTEYLTSYSINYLNMIPLQKIIVYDGNKVISQFSDMITSGYLLVQGRKVTIKQKIILQLRNLSQCSPSFIQNCQIIYIGNVVSKVDKFLRHCNIQKQSQVFKLIQEIFQVDLKKMNEKDIQTIAKFVNKYKDISQVRSIHKIIIWLLTVLSNEDLWQKNYSGKYTDFTVHQKFLQLVPIDPSRVSLSRYYDSNFYYVPTKSLVLTSQLVNCLIKTGINVQIYGNQQIGKTSFFKLLGGTKINLSIYQSTQNWSEHLKDKLLIVRKQGKDHLLPIGQGNYKIIIDDLDLGLINHSQFTRQIVEIKKLRDSKYHGYLMENFHIIASSRTKNHNSKIDQSLVKIPLLPHSKESLTTIFLINMQNLVKSYSMNRQVVDYFERTVLKNFLIAFDDLTNLYSSNISTSNLISILKDLLSLPRKNSYISVDDFSSLSKSIFYQKLIQKSFNKKIKWQLQSIFENVVKITQGNNANWQYWINLDSAYKKTTYQQIVELIRQKFQNLIVYKDMIENIIYINNQLQGLNSNLVIVGRKGVGKRHIVKIAASLNKLQIVTHLKDAIFNAIKNRQCILIQEIKKHSVPLYQQLLQCQIDGDLQKFIQIQQKQKFRQHLNNSQGYESVQILTKVKKFIKSIVLVDDKHQYLKICERCRQFNQFSVSILEQWPVQAIVGVYKTIDNNQKLHAQLFSSSNIILVQNGLHSMPMTIYEKYIQIYSTIYENKLKCLVGRQQQLSKIYNKFNESCIIIRQWQQKVGTLEVQVTQTIEDLSKSIEINKLNSFVSFILTKQLHEKQSLIMLKKQNLQRSKDQMEKQVLHTKKILQKIQKIISSLQRTQMSQLKKIYRTNKLVQFGLECLCILFKQKQQDINDKTINKLLADPNLLMKMKSQTILQVKNSYLITKFKKQIVEYEHSLKTHTTQTSKILIEWVRAIIQYWQTNQIYLQKKKQYKKLQLQYDQVQKDFSKISEDLKNIHTRSIRLNQAVVQMEKQKQKKQNQLLSISKKLQNSAQIIPILLQAENQIDSNIKKIRILKQNLIGNTILTSFTASFLPLRRLTIKHKLLQECKRLLRRNFLSYSDSFINDTINQNFLVNIFQKDMNSVEDLNVYLLQNFDQKVKIIIDPQRKAINFLQKYQKKTLHTILNLIVQKAQEIQQEQITTQKIYHSVSQTLKVQTQRHILIDWKTIQMNPQQKLFDKIAYSKKPQYFIAKQQLSNKVNQNLRKIQNMKQELYKEICESSIHILDNQKFIQNGKILIQLQQETKKMEKQVQQKIQLIKNLQKSIQDQVNKIFIMLKLFKQIRPIGLDLMLDAAEMEGDSIQNVISWSLANLSVHDRNGWLLAVAHQFQGKSHQQLLNDIIINTPLRNNDIKLKKPALVNGNLWQKVLKLSTYTENLKHLVEIAQKHQKQFQNWSNDYSLMLPSSLCPENLQFTQHLFLIHHLKPKIFPQSIELIIQKALIKYDLKPFKNINLFTQTNPLFPIIYNSSLFTLQKYCDQINALKMNKLRIGSIRSQSQMRKQIWKSMEAGQWMVLYGISSHEDINWIQRIVYYVINYTPHQGFRVVIMVDQSQNNSENISQKNLVLNSKYLSNIGIHMHQQILSYTQLMKCFQLAQDINLNLTGNFIKDGILSMLLQEGTSKSPRISSRNKTRKGSMNQLAHQKASSLIALQKANLSLTQNKQIQSNNSLLQIPKENKSLQNGSFVLTNTKSPDRFLNRLYKHWLLFHLVVVKKFNQRLASNNFDILNRSLQIFKYIEQNFIPIQFNVQSIGNYLVKLYSKQLLHEDRKCLQQIMQRIVDETKFMQKTIYGVNIATFSNVQKQLQKNSAIIGADQSAIVRRYMERIKNTKKVLDKIYSPLNLKLQTAFLRTSFSKIPVLLSNKQIKNQNYLNFFIKQQKIHNQLLKNTQILLNWINTYSTKDQNGQEIQAQNQYNWQNLLRYTQKYLGLKINRNQLIEAVNSFCHNIKHTHDFLLYFNPMLNSFSLNPKVVSNLSVLLSTYIINYMAKNQIKDGHNYIPNLQFKKIGTNNVNNEFLLSSGIQGVILSNLNYRDFKFNGQYKSIQSLSNAGDLDGQQKCPLIVFKLRKLLNIKKEQEQIVISLPIKLKQKVLYSLQFMCNSTYQQFNMRDNSLVTQ